MERLHRGKVMACDKGFHDISLYYVLTTKYYMKIDRVNFRTAFHGI